MSARKTKMLLSGVTAALAAALAQPALAQDAAQPAAADNSASGEEEAQNSGLGDIVVYAQRRARGAELQDVPMSVTAIDSSLMAAAHTVDLRDIGRLVPNAQLDGVGTFPGFANFFMRGVGVSTSIRSLDPAINVIQDGMVIGYQAGAVLDTFDLESVEVLRGPQGVLFGRNASGGAVVLRSRRPTGENKGHADVTVGNAGQIDTHTSYEGTLADKIYGRVSVSTRRNNGYFRNRTDGTFVNVPSNPNQTGVPIQHRTGGVPYTGEIVVKPTVVFDVSDDTKVTLLTQYQNYDDGGGPSYAYIPKSGTLTPLQTQWGYYPSGRKYSTNLAIEGYTKIEAYHAIAELEQKIGPGTLTAIGAYRHIEYDSTLNVSGDPYSIIVFPDGRERNRQWSVEARYNVELGSGLELLVGGFYFDMLSDVEEYRINRSAATTLRTYQVNIWDQKVKSYAAFANLDWQIIPELTVSAGLRYSKDQKRMHVIPLASCTGQNFVGCPTLYQTSKRSWDDVSPRIVANFQPTRDLTLYASYSKGYRAGNYNARATTTTAAITPANPETVGSYELGLKSEFLDRHVRFNVVGFYQKYDDIQRIVQFLVGTENVQSLFNAASATIKGVEAELAVMPFTGLRIDGSLGYTKARYDSFVGLAGLPAGKSATDLEFDRVPKWTAHIEGGYNFRLPGDEGEFAARLSYTWRDGVFTDVNNTVDLRQDSFSIVDASLNYQRDNWKVSLFGRNLFNTFYADIRSRATGFQAYGGAPRTYGIQFGFDF